MKIVIACESRTGQTTKIAGYIQQHLQNRGHQAELVRARDRKAVEKINGAQGVIIGAPVRAGHHHGRVVKFIKANRELLNRKKCAFYSVCLSAKENTETARAETDRYHQDLKARTGWQPPLVTAFAGGLPYSRYNFLIKFILKKINQKQGGDADTSRDYEYTDWKQVAGFADRFVG